MLYIFYLLCKIDVTFIQIIILAWVGLFIYAVILICAYYLFVVISLYLTIRVTYFNVQINTTHYYCCDLKHRPLILQYLTVFFYKIT